jgi:hypothetical protein
VRNALAAAAALIGCLAVPSAALAWGIDASQAPYDVACDGSDETAAIQAALDAANRPGDTVLLPPGDCGVSAPLEVRHGATVVQGSGTGQRMKGSQDSVGTRIVPIEGTFAGSEVIRVQAIDAKGAEATCAPDCEPVYSVTLRDLAIDVNPDASLTDSVPANVDGIYFRSNVGLLMNVKVHNATRHGIRLRGYTPAEASPAGWSLYDTQVFNVQVYRARGDAMRLEDGATDLQLSHVILAGSDASGLHFAGGTSEQINTSHFYDNADYNLFFDGSGSRTKIANSKIEEAGKHGLYVNSCASAPADVQLVGNSFSDNGRSSPNTYSHIYLQSSEDCGGTRPARAARLQIAANNFTSKSASSSPYPRHALRLGSATGNTGDEALVQANAFGSGHTTSSAVDLASSAKVVFSGNSGFKTEMGDTALAVSTARDGTTVNIPHGLAVKPNAVSAQPADAVTAELPRFYVSSVTSSSIVLTYTGTVPAGTYRYAVAAAAR